MEVDFPSQMCNEDNQCGTIQITEEIQSGTVKTFCVREFFAAHVTKLGLGNEVFSLANRVNHRCRR